jgi:hypothetical protein
MSTRVGKSYEYNALCDVCGFAYKNYELKKRWDGFMVCDADWEPRHVLDFYRTKNDTHTLPFTLPDQDELTWTPVFSALTQVIGNGAITITGIYKRDAFNSKINFTCTIQLTSNATTASAASTMTLPVTSVGAGTARVLDQDSVPLGNIVIAGAATTLTLPTWATRNKSITITGTYGY